MEGNNKPQYRTGFGPITLHYEEEIEVGDIWKFVYNGRYRVVRVESISPSGRFTGRDLTAPDAEYRSFYPHNAKFPTYICGVDG